MQIHSSRGTKVWHGHYPDAESGKRGGSGAALQRSRWPGLRDRKRPRAPRRHGYGLLREDDGRDIRGASPCCASSMPGATKTARCATSSPQPAPTRPPYTSSTSGRAMRHLCGSRALSPPAVHACCSEAGQNMTSRWQAAQAETRGGGMAHSRERLQHALKTSRAS